MKMDEVDPLNSLFLNDPEKSALRLEICSQCPLMLEVNEGGIGPVCSVCGCLLPPLSILRDVECPEGKWPAVEEG